jgi:hypothetical protein
MFLIVYSVLLLQMGGDRFGVTWGIGCAVVFTSQQLLELLYVNGFL